MPADRTLSCGEEVPPAPDLTAIDKCQDNQISGALTTEIFPDKCEGYTIHRTWTFTDSCGNRSTARQSITVPGNAISKLPQPPEDLIVECGGGVPEAEPLTALSDCGEEFIGQPNDAARPNECTGYTIVRSWTFTDACGLDSRVSQKIKVLGHTVSQLPEPPKDLIVECGGEVPPAETVIAIDDCGNQITGQPNDVAGPADECDGYTITRTWTFINACKQISSVSQKITMRGSGISHLPTPPGKLIVECGGKVPPGSPLTVIDDCGTKITAFPKDALGPGSDCEGYSVLRTWTFTDDCGNTGQVSQDITVLGRGISELPQPPKDLIVECASKVPEAEPLIAIDDCGKEIIGQPYDAVKQPDECSGYSITRSWTFTDACGTDSQIRQKITVLGIETTQLPEPPKALVLACSDKVPPPDSLVAFDNCGNKLTGQLNEAVEPGEECDGYTITRTWSFVNACRKISSVSQKITVSGGGISKLPHPPEDLTVECSDKVPPAEDLTAIDDCGEEITVSPIDKKHSIGECLHDFTINRTWIFTDACGNKESVTQTIIVLDTLAPVPQAAPADLNLACVSDVPPPVNLTATDNCDGDITVSPTVHITPGGCLNDYSMVRTWTFSDTCGNTSSVSQTITVLDTLAPVPQTAPADLSLECAEDVPPPVNLTATDNCHGDITVSPTTLVTPGACLNDFTMVRTWTFTDTCGNTSSVSQTITVLDTLAPVPQAAPAALSLECADDVPPPVNLTATDNCDGDITVSPTVQVTPGACLNDFTLVRTWTFSDTCGNTSSVSQTIIVLDTLASVPQAVPADLNLACASDVPPPVNLTATDNCDGDITVSPTTLVIPGACLNDFTMVRTWTFSDTCGNTSSVSQTITVLDTLAPVASAAPADLSLECADDVPAPIDLTATDNCDGYITVSPNTQVIPGSCINDFTMIRTWTFSDTCGNTSSVSQTITVLDTLAPVPQAAPTDLSLECADDVPPPVNLTATDNCNGDISVSPTTTVIPGACLNDFTMVRTWTFTDTCGNTSSVSQTITVLDTLAPVVTAPADIPALSCTKSTDPANTGGATATDNCDGELAATYSDVIVEGAGVDCYTIERTWSATDTCGNTASPLQTINVVDTIPPTFVDCPADVELTCTEDVPPVAYPQATDNCDNEVDVVYNGEVRDDSCSEDYYTLTRSWTATDNCGNATTGEQVITVNTRLTDPCYSITFELEYNEEDNTTRFTWELCLIGEDCKDISNIRFSIPCDLPKSYLLDTYSSVDGLRAEINGRTGRCTRYDVQFDGFSDGALQQEPGQCATYSYLIRGDLRDWETDVSIKAGNQGGLGFEDVGPTCSCTKEAGALTPQELANEPVYFDQRGAEGLSDVQLFPNPVDEMFTLRFVNPTGQPVMVQVYDATGRLQLVRRIITSEGFNQVDFEVTNLPSGLYKMILIPETGSPHIRPFIRIHR
ncbi:hypothetical protein GGR26_002564 [Lewinella marina]|uniref:T9SS type A sorting domain-containing protein n=1 Tax=Neolewinella marina TaxID=438751 RepID=UPI0014300017|nr:T9SS type A sorting domain-containing protein [Neolewinella marina]NJB86787.1 hypothetical protein [Neolewinella marina]